MNPQEKKIRTAEAAHTRSAMDEIMGNVDDAKQARANTKKAAQDVTDAWNPGGEAPSAKKPGFFSRVASGFRNLGNRITAFFGATPAAASAAPAPSMAAQSAGRDRVDSISDDTEMKNNLNVTYTRAQGRQAAADLGAAGSLNITNARAKMGQAVAQTEDFVPEEDVKKSLNVTMTRSEALEAAKQLSKEQASKTHSQDRGLSL